MDQTNTVELPQVSGPLLVLYILAFVASLVMLPTALATWYSKCYNISLLYGFAIVFSSLVVGLVSLIFPEDIRNYLQTFYATVMCCVIIYGVFLQFTGKCNLGMKL